MTQEEVMAWLIKLGLGCIWGIVVCAVILGMGMTSDYIAASAARSDKCINSACDLPCTPGAKFQRHKGECK
jgi:uncharacterized membrane protein YkvI